MSTATRRHEVMTLMIDIIEEQTRAYTATRSQLAEAVIELEDELCAIRTKRIDKIKACVHTAGDEQSKLHQLLTEHPELFYGKQRTITVNNVKVDYHKRRGKIIID